MQGEIRLFDQGTFKAFGVLDDRSSAGDSAIGSCSPCKLSAFDVKALRKVSSCATPFSLSPYKGETLPLTARNLSE